MLSVAAMLIMMKAIMLGVIMLIVVAPHKEPISDTAYIQHKNTGELEKKIFTMKSLRVKLVCWRHDIRHNGIQHNHIQHNVTCIIVDYCYDKCHFC
jgi:hypothetical protein